MKYPLAVFLSEEAADWMTGCHPDRGVVAEVSSRLIERVQKLTLLGELYGTENKQPIKKLDGFKDLWEIRLRHPTGWYRMFFMFVRMAGEDAVAIASGVVKHSELPRSTYETAERRVYEFIEILRTDAAARQRYRKRFL